MARDPPAVPYGCATVPPNLGDVRCIRPVAGRALRLRDAGPELAEPPPAGVPPLLALRDRLTALCDPWATLPRRFLARYVDLIAWRIADQAEALRARLAPFGTLYRIEDFAFSALLPLPRAHVRRADGAGWIAVDVAFWTGAVLIALDVVDSRRTVRRRAADHAALGAAGALAVALPPAALDGEAAALAALLPPALLDFCAGDTLPASPFLPAPLGDIVDGTLDV